MPTTMSDRVQELWERGDPPSEAAKALGIDSRKVRSYYARFDKRHGKPQAATPAAQDGAQGDAPGAESPPPARKTPDLQSAVIDEATGWVTRTVQVPPRVEIRYRALQKEIPQIGTFGQFITNILDEFWRPNIDPDGRLVAALTDAEDLDGTGPAPASDGQQGGEEDGEDEAGPGEGG